jgi:hypothetical protein
MGLWFGDSFPALILVLSFITILLRARTFETFGAWPHFAGSAHAPGTVNEQSCCGSGRDVQP